MTAAPANASPNVATIATLLAGALAGLVALACGGASAGAGVVILRRGQHAPA